MTCAHCGRTFIGPVHIERGRIVCWACWDAVRRKSRLGRLGYWLRILTKRRVIPDAELLD